MIVLLNNEPFECADNSTISELVVLLKLDSTRGTAIAVNNKIVSKNEWNSFYLNERDKLVLIRATQGG